MKIVALIIVLIFLAYFFWPRSNYSEDTNINDLPKYFDLLQNSTPPLDTLIISVERTDQFIQFSRDQDKVEIDFPLITDKQKLLELQYKTELEANNLEIRESLGADGSRFIDADLPQSTELRSKITKNILTNIFGVTDGEKLTFTLQ